MGTPPWGGVRRWQLLEKTLSKLGKNWSICGAYKGPRNLQRLDPLFPDPEKTRVSNLDGKGVIIQITKYQQDIRVPSYK